MSKPIIFKGRSYLFYLEIFSVKIEENSLGKSNVAGSLNILNVTKKTVPVHVYATVWTLGCMWGRCESMIEHCCWVE